MCVCVRYLLVQEVCFTQFVNAIYITFLLEMVIINQKVKLHWLKCPPDVTDKMKQGVWFICMFWSVAVAVHVYLFLTAKQRAYQHISILQDISCHDWRAVHILCAYIPVLHTYLPCSIAAFSSCWYSVVLMFIGLCSVVIVEE